MEPVIRKMRLGWSVSDGQLLVVAATRQQALARFESLSRPKSRFARRPLCGADGCGDAAVAGFNDVWLCAAHCNAALDELRSAGIVRPVEFGGDVQGLVDGTFALGEADHAAEDAAGQG